MRATLQQALDALETTGTNDGYFGVTYFFDEEKVDAAISAIKQALAQPDTCIWTPYDCDIMPDTWESSCGRTWSFIDGGPKENNFKFCHGCGRPMEVQE